MAPEGVPVSADEEAPEAEEPPVIRRQSALRIRTASPSPKQRGRAAPTDESGGAKARRCGGGVGRSPSLPARRRSSEEGGGEGPRQGLSCWFQSPV